MRWLIDRLSPSRWPWSVRAFLLVVALALVFAWSMTEPKLYGTVACFSLFYAAFALIFVISRNDWVRFALTGFHLLGSALIIYGLIYVLPTREPGELFPFRVMLIFATTIATTVLLWHPATGKWVMARS